MLKVSLVIKGQFYKGIITGLCSTVGNVSGNRCESDCRSGGCKFDLARSNTFVEIDHEIISTVTFSSLPLNHSRWFVVS